MCQQGLLTLRCKGSLHRHNLKRHLCSRGTPIMLPGAILLTINGVKWLTHSRKLLLRHMLLKHMLLRHMVLSCWTWCLLSVPSAPHSLRQIMVKGGHLHMGSSQGNTSEPGWPVKSGWPKLYLILVKALRIKQLTEIRWEKWTQVDLPETGFRNKEAG